MKTINLLLVFGFFLYAGLITIAIIFNGSLIETIKDLSIITIGSIIGYVISHKLGSNSNKKR